MKSATYITTSWDDGHPLDFRVAKMLARYGLHGTFYIPRSAPHTTMTAAQIRDLSAAFEIGAHTLNHIELPRATAQQVRQELAESRSWLEDITGKPCRMFCPPKGKYRRHHLPIIREAGYVGVRTVELLSLDFPRPLAGLQVMPTTLQAHPHGAAAYLKNVARRAAFRNLGQFLRHGRSTDWTGLVRSLLPAAIEQGGVFHLWGHSWELEENGQWQRLEEALRIMGEFAREAPAVANGQLCQAPAPASAAVNVL